MADEDFYTFREYMKKEGASLTASTEDYLEMIYRLSLNAGYTRIHELADALNVRPPSATKMVQKLTRLNFVECEKYGIIVLKKKGRQMGKALIQRHETIESFLKLLGISEGLLEETEKIEHTISAQTLDSLGDFVSFLKSKPEIIKDFEIYHKTKGNFD